MLLPPFSCTLQQILSTAHVVMYQLHRLVLNHLQQGRLFPLSGPFQVKDLSIQVCFTFLHLKWLVKDVKPTIWVLESRWTLDDYTILGQITQKPSESMGGYVFKSFCISAALNSSSPKPYNWCVMFAQVFYLCFKRRVWSPVSSPIHALSVSYSCAWRTNHILSYIFHSESWKSSKLDSMLSTKINEVGE